MSYQSERDLFIVQMHREGLSLGTARRLLSTASTLQRHAEMMCSSEAANSDRVPCPAALKGSRACLCDGVDGKHETVTRIDVDDYNLERRVRAMMPEGWQITTQGDPRGYVLRVIPPSYADRNQGKDVHNLDSIGVPAR